MNWLSGSMPDMSCRLTRLALLSAYISSRPAVSIDSTRQKRHYEAIHTNYEDHYYDAQSMAYRERFYYDPLFEGLDLNGCTVADLASGSGHSSVALLKRFPKAVVTGFDISSSACEAYRRNVGRPG